MEDDKGNRGENGCFWDLEPRFSNLDLRDLGLILRKTLRYLQKGAKEESEGA